MARKQRRPAEKLRGLTRRVEQLEQLSERMSHIVERAESAVERATEALTTSEAAHLRVGSIEVVNNRGEPMVAITATDIGGSVLIRAGSGEEVGGLVVDERSCGALVIRDPSGAALVGIQIRAGRGELLTMSNQGETCAIGPGRPAKND